MVALLTEEVNISHITSAASLERFVVFSTYVQHIQSLKYLSMR